MKFSKMKFYSKSDSLPIKIVQRTENHTCRALVGFHTLKDLYRIAGGETHFINTTKTYKANVPV